MQQVWANDLQDLRELLSPDEIIREVAEFYRRRDGVLLEGEALFLRAYRACECVHQNAEGEANARRVAREQYEEFLAKKTIPLCFARCLLPGFLGK